SASLTSSGSGFSLLLRFATVICAPVADSFLPNDRLHKNFYTLTKPRNGRRVRCSSVRQFSKGEADECTDIRASRARRPLHRANFRRRGGERGENRALARAIKPASGL
ncbi:hypothetical protein, partial [Paraburkholderia podalyriae]|uniref:hypothetical protein n=1 Tax=Paraburkholderia podalyriae TaxID=1938811 RepID=UPI001CA3E544